MLPVAYQLPDVHHLLVLDFTRLPRHRERDGDLDRDRSRCVHLMATSQSLRWRLACVGRASYAKVDT